MTTPPSQTGLPPRQCAVQLLANVFGKRVHLEQAQEANTVFRTLSHADKAFCLRLVRLVCARHGELDALIDGWLENPLPENSANEIRQILRLGLAQLLLAGIPAHAAVHSSVELAKQTHQGRFSGLVNALLNRAVRDGAVQLQTLDGYTLNQPEWFRLRLEAAYGKEQARAIYAAQMNEAPVDLSLRGEAPTFPEDVDAIPLPTGSIRLHRAHGLENLPGYHEGLWWVQDAAAALPAMMLDAGKGAHVLDVCAAPGGKTMQLAAKGCVVTAIDRSAPRNDRLKENMTRMGFDVECVTADAVQWQPGRQWDFILLDAPCSATGTLRRHPEVVLTRGAEDIAKLTRLQAELLEQCFSLLKPGGIMVYAVCSLLAEEGTQQIQTLLAREPHAKLAPLPEEIRLPAELMASAAELRTLPSHWADIGGMDGFYAARIQKSE